MAKHLLKDKTIKYRDLVVVFKDTEIRPIIEITCSKSTVRVNNETLISSNILPDWKGNYLKDKRVTFGSTNALFTHTDNGYSLDIETRKAEIICNGKTIWLPWNHKDYLLVHGNMKEFIANAKPENMSIEQNGELLIDTWIKRQPIMFIFHEDRKKYIRARFDFFSKDTIFDQIESIDLPENEVKNIREQVNKLIEDLEKTSKCFKMPIEYSHHCDGIWGWWDFKFLPKNWNEENFLRLIDMLNLAEVQIKNLENKLY